MSDGSTIKQLRSAIVEQLSSFSALQSVTILYRQVGDFEKAIDEVMAMGTGVCLTVFTPVIRKVTKRAQGPYFSELLCRIKCAENPVLNQSDFDAEMLAELVFQRMHLVQVKVGGTMINPLRAAEPATDDSGLGGVDIMDYESSPPRKRYTMREIDCLFLADYGLTEARQ